LFLGEEDVAPGRIASAEALRRKLADAALSSSRYLWIVDRTYTSLPFLLVSF
jgi:hypothetical protein